MCKVSSKLKLCTCNTEDIYAAEHYWIFHRFEEDKNNFIIGQLMLPPEIDPAIHKFNQRRLALLLNKENPFDIKIEPKEKDRLQLAFTIPPNAEHIVYGFEYRNNRWRKCGFDTLEWQWFHNEEKLGEIKNALQ